MTRLADGIEVEGPVQAEVFVVWLNGDHLELTGPCGAAPWLIELGEVEHPVAVVERIVRDVVGPPVLVHSTSWRRDRSAVVLSFVVVIDPSLVVDSFASVYVAEKVISGFGGAPPYWRSDRVMDASGCIVTPGFFDLAARLR